MNIVRKIKLEKLGYYTYKDNREKELFEFIKNNLLNLKEIYLDEYHNEVFWFNKENVVFIYSLKYLCVDIRHDIWNFIETQLKFTYEETNIILRNIIKENYKINVITIYKLSIKEIILIENEYSKKNKD